MSCPISRWSLSNDLQGRILMTHPTKAITHTLLRDFVKVSRGSADEGLYTEKDLADTLERTEVMDFYQTVDIDGIRVRASPAAVASVWRTLLRFCVHPCKTHNLTGHCRCKRHHTKGSHKSTLHCC